MFGASSKLASVVEFGFNEARDNGVDHIQIICTWLGTDNHTGFSSVNFYRSDARPDAEPTVRKHLKAYKILEKSDSKIK